MKLSVNETKLNDLWARNCATIQQVVILKLPSRQKIFQVFRETGPLVWFTGLAQLVKVVLRVHAKFPVWLDETLAS